MSNATRVLVIAAAGLDDLLAAARWWTAKATLHVVAFAATMWALPQSSGGTSRAVRGPRGLLLAAAILGGFLAGGNVDRTFIQMPAWRILGPAAWADFSRHADMGHGFFWYPFEAIGATVCLLAAVVAVWRRQRHLHRAANGGALPLYLALAFAIAGLAITTQAAPKMLSIREIPDGNVSALQHAFEGFEWWGNLRGLVQVAAFLASVWALAVFDQPQDDSQS